MCWPAGSGGTDSVRKRRMDSEITRMMVYIQYPEINRFLQHASEDTRIKARTLHILFLEQRIYGNLPALLRAQILSRSTSEPVFTGLHFQATIMIS